MRKLSLEGLRNKPGVTHQVLPNRSLGNIPAFASGGSPAGSGSEDAVGWVSCRLRGAELGLARSRFHELHRGATLPGVGPFHRPQRPVGEHATPPVPQQSPVEEPAAHAPQERWRGARGPGD